MTISKRIVILSTTPYSFGLNKNLSRSTQFLFVGKEKLSNFSTTSSNSNDLPTRMLSSPALEIPYEDLDKYLFRDELASITPSSPQAEQDSTNVDL